MQYYVEIRILPDPEFPPSVLMNTLFAKLHYALAKAEHRGIGVSFPDAGNDLGGILRIHGGQKKLHHLMGTQWHSSMLDYADVTTMQRAPEKCHYRIVKRVQARSSAERLYRRSVKKGWLSPDAAEKKIANCNEKRLKHPYVRIKSASTGQLFRIFIDQGKIFDSPVQGDFSAYGQSLGGTVPWF